MYTRFPYQFRCNVIFNYPATTRANIYSPNYTRRQPPFRVPSSPRIRVIRAFRETRRPRAPRSLYVPLYVCRTSVVSVFFMHKIANHVTSTTTLALHHPVFSSTPIYRRILHLFENPHPLPRRATPFDGWSFSSFFRGSPCSFRGT